MAIIRTGQLRTVPGVYYAVEQKSRVISATRRMVDPGANPPLVTEPVANDFRLLKVQVWSVWRSYTGIPLILFDFRVGILPEGVDVDTTNWESLLVLKVGNVTGVWIVSPEMMCYEWTMRKEYLGQGKRFAVVPFLIGVGDVDFYASFQVEEG